MRESNPSSSKILIVGFGSEIRGDDGVGFVVASRLIDWQQGGAAPEGWTYGERPGLLIHASHQLGPELAADLRDTSAAIFVDAACDIPPGSVRAVAVEAEEGEMSAHDLTPPVLLGLCRQVFGRVPRAVLITAGGQDFALGLGLTPVVEAALPRVFGELAAQLHRLASRA